MKFTSLILTSLLLIQFAQAQELCEPISKSRFTDEIGGFKSELREYLLAELSPKMVEEGWSLLPEGNSGTEETLCTEIKIVPRSTLFTGNKRQAFLTSLQEEKINILTFYNSLPGFNISDRDYNHLVYLAIGLAGAESRFGTSLKYKVKNIITRAPWLESYAKCLYKWDWEYCNSETMTSRGPTQIKKPPLIADEYNITRKNLSDYKNSAIATMGFLIETLEWYKGLLASDCKDLNCSFSVQRNEGETEVHLFEFEDYPFALTYLYRGAKYEIYNSTATPQKSCYLKRIQKYSEYIDVWYREKEVCE